MYPEIKFGKRCMLDAVKCVAKTPDELLKTLSKCKSGQLVLRHKSVIDNQR